MKRTVLVLAGALALATVDRIIKSWAVYAEPTHGFFVSFGYVPNAGGVFSAPVPPWLLMAGAVVALVTLVVLGTNAWRKHHLLALGGVSLMFVGGVSNLFDRLFLPGVVDVFTVPGGLSFNLSDLYLLGGLVLLVF